MLLLLQVQKFYEVECATSSCAKDKMRKRLGPTIYQEGTSDVPNGYVQGLYLLLYVDYPESMLTLALQAMYENFKEQNPLLFKPTGNSR